MTTRAEMHRQEVNLLEQRVIETLEERRSITRGELNRLTQSSRTGVMDFIRVINRLRRGGLIALSGNAHPEQMIFINQDW